MDAAGSIELRMLAWSVLLGLAQIMVAAAFASQQRGWKWAPSARDSVAPMLTGVAGRLDRAMKNFNETFPFFAAAVLGVVATAQGNDTSALGAQVYFWSRVLYVPLYAAGIPYLRSVVWAVSIVGLLMVLAPLL